MIVMRESAEEMDPVAAAAAALAEAAQASAEAYTPALLAEMVRSEAEILLEGPIALVKKFLLSLRGGRPSGPPEGPAENNYAEMEAEVAKVERQYEEKGLSRIVARGVIAEMDRSIAYVSKLPPSDRIRFGAGDGFVTAEQALSLLKRKRAAAFRALAK